MEGREFTAMIALIILGFIMTGIAWFQESTFLLDQRDELVNSINTSNNYLKLSREGTNIFGAKYEQDVEWYQKVNETWEAGSISEPLILTDINKVTYKGKEWTISYYEKQ